jgi:hypothetical protein
LPDTYLLDTGSAMVLVTVPESPSGELARAITSLDMIGIHGPKELMTVLAPPKLAALRALGLEVLVLDVDANAFAAKTSEMTSTERASYIDARIDAARSRLRRASPGH